MLNIKGISKTFFPNTVNEVRALRNVSLTIEEGSFTAIIGTNGSGKSTLLNAIAGTAIPEKGSILLNGADISSWPEYKRAKLIGRVFQNPFAGTAAEMSIAENLVVALKRGQHRPMSLALNRKIRTEIADRVSMLKMGLEDRLDNEIGTLSGGQRQALTLLMATWLRPGLLLLDEHTAALDPSSAAQVAELTRQIIAQEKLTALMVTHSMQQAVNLGNRIIMMHQGKIAFDFRGEEKRRLKVNDLLTLFDELRQKDNIDPAVAALLEEFYI